MMKRASWIALSVSVSSCSARRIAGVAAYEHGRPGLGMHMRFERMAVRLKLTSAQESQIKADLKQARTNAQARISIR